MRLTIISLAVCAAVQAAPLLNSGKGDSLDILNEVKKIDDFIAGSPHGGELPRRADTTTDGETGLLNGLSTDGLTDGLGSSFKRSFKELSPNYPILTEINDIKYTLSEIEGDEESAKKYTALIYADLEKIHKSIQAKTPTVAVQENVYTLVGEAQQNVGLAYNLEETNKPFEVTLQKADKELKQAEALL